MFRRIDDDAELITCFSLWEFRAAFSTNSFLLATTEMTLASYTTWKLAGIARDWNSARWTRRHFRRELLLFLPSSPQSVQITDEWNSFILPAVFFHFLPARDLKPDEVGEVRPRGLKLTVIVPPYSDLRSGFTAPCGLPNQTAVINSLPPVPSLDPAKKRRQTRSRSQIWRKVPWGRGLPATRAEKKRKSTHAAGGRPSVYQCCSKRRVNLSHATPRCPRSGVRLIHAHLWWRRGWRVRRTKWHIVLRAGRPTSVLHGRNRKSIDDFAKSVTNHKSFGFRRSTSHFLWW